MHKHKQKSQSVFTWKASSAKRMQKLFAAATITALLLMILSFRVDAQSGPAAFPEYQRYVHTELAWQLDLRGEAYVPGLL
jgi:hypothetical protein